jgi:hypothetical protein
MEHSVAALEHFRAVHIIQFAENRTALPVGTAGWMSTATCYRGRLGEGVYVRARQPLLSSSGRRPQTPPIL